jgi:peroxiredoxin
MKTPAFVLAFLFLIGYTSPVENYPVAGTTYVLQYDPASMGLLTDSDQILVVYAFDYWGTKVVQRLRGEGEQEDLFRNVLNPDEGRSLTKEMVRRGNRWSAEIPVPVGASLISYYFTDGTRNDYNDRMTYVSYVYGEDGIPVRGARFRNIDFLIMAGKDHSVILDEIRQEIADYPDHFIAHVVYWRFRFFDTVSPDTLMKLMEESARHFSDLHDEYGDTVLNYTVLSLNDINRVMQLSLRERFDEKEIVALRERVNTSILETIDLIPADKKLQQISPIASTANYMLLTPEERLENEREIAEQFMRMVAEFVGEPAPDFSFETITGEKYRLSDFRGRYIFLEFWGSWCGPCVQEIPNLVEVYDMFRDRDFVMISISNDASASDWDRQQLTEYTGEKGMEWIQVLDDHDNTIHTLYNIRFWPNMFLIDKGGTVLQRQGLRGEQLKETLADLLGE